MKRSERDTNLDGAAGNFIRPPSIVAHLWRSKSFRHVGKLVGTTVGLVLCVAGFAWMISELREQSDALSDLVRGRSAWIFLIASTLIYGASIFICAYVWSLLLFILGETVSTKHAVGIFAVSQIGKYVPGNIAHHIGRLTLSKNIGLSLRSVSLSMVLELGGVIAAAAVVTSTLTDVFSWRGFNPLPGVFANATVLKGFGVVAISAFTASVWIAHERREERHDWSSATWPLGRLRLLGLGLAAFALLIVNFGLYGITCVVLGERVFGVAHIDAGQATTIFAIAWLAGFLTPGAPAGLGIREAVLLTLFGQAYEESVAVGLTVALRTISIAGDGLVFLVGLAMTNPRTGSRCSSDER